MIVIRTLLVQGVLPGSLEIRARDAFGVVKGRSPDKKKPRQSGAGGLKLLSEPLTQLIEEGRILPAIPKDVQKGENVLFGQGREVDIVEHRSLLG
ncbi:hypothetical protein [Thioalkalivibrio sp. K90mix]|uniref:hypothetical protein n=1 Tax=Thioalkalivibrio sp. (strain K90mix) TaxID=396595 RepID=UPI00143B11EE|nr:hypothetical protein [Thioalkalivibrio sp. K90mix]